MYNLLQYSKNDRKTTDSLWNYYRDEPNSPPCDDYNADPTTNSESFKYKTNIAGSSIEYNVPERITNEEGNQVPNLDYDANKIDTKEVEIVVSLKHLSNFWELLDMPLIYCEVSLTLTSSKNCVMTDLIVRIAGGKNLPAIAAPTGAKFKITDTKLYVPLITLSAENDNKLLEQLKTGFKRTITWNKYRSEISNQTINKNLNYLIDPTFTNVNRLFVLSFENEADRNSYEKYYVSKVEIKDFNVLIDGKPFFEIPVKSKEKAYEKIIEMSRNNDYTTGNLLKYEDFSEHYKLIAIDLSKQIELENLSLKQQINFIGRREREEGATIFFIIEKKEETTFDILQNSVTVV